MKNIWMWIAIIVIVLAGGYYYSNNSGTYLQPPTVPQTTETSQVAPALQVSTGSALGDYLIASNGKTLYTFTKDAPDVSNCSGVCAQNWPAYTIASQGDLAGLIAASGVNGALGSIAKTDGTIQLTYNKMPLYFWVGDAKAGETNGQGVGGVWFVAKP
jgi:predicted lipoprotein with Yx(FWY)xxD motif